MLDCGFFSYKSSTKFLKAKFLQYEIFKGKISPNTRNTKMCIKYNIQSVIFSVMFGDFQLHYQKYERT